MPRYFGKLLRTFHAWQSVYIRGMSSFSVKDNKVPIYTLSHCYFSITKLSWNKRPNNPPHFQRSIELERAQFILSTAAVSQWEDVSLIAAVTLHEGSGFMLRAYSTMNKAGAQSPAGISGRTRKGCNGTLTAMVINSTSSRKCGQRTVLDGVVKVTTLVWIQGLAFTSIY